MLGMHMFYKTLENFTRSSKTPECYLPKQVFFSLWAFILLMPDGDFTLHQKEKVVSPKSYDV